jgi:protein-L-isoaspartate(D-aspartate) O-methyltransferase
MPRTPRPRRTAPARTRAFYARIAAAKGGALRAALEDAFARVPRERFLGPPPWYAVTAAGYVRVPGDDPTYVYQDLLFALDPEKGINNGEPTLHGQLIAALEPGPGDTVLHIGCGTGYYSAILAELVGPEGRIVAYEIEPDLAARASEYLAPWTNVEVRAQSGTEAGLPRANAIYVNAGATRPLPVWLDLLEEGGRLVFPLITEEGWGVTLKVLRRGGGFWTWVLNQIRFIGCAGATDPGEGAAVAESIRRGDLLRTRSLRRESVPDETAVLVGHGWWLSSSLPPEEGSFGDDRC